MAIRNSRVLPAIMIAATLAGPASAASLEYNLFLHQGYRSFKVGDYFKARDYFTRAVDLHLRSAEARFALAEALAALGQFEECVIQMRHGIRIDSRWPSKDYPRYGFYADSKTLDKHLDKLRRDVSEFPKDANARLILAYNLFHLGLLPDAADLFVEAENILGKKDPIARNYLSAMKQKGVSSANESVPVATTSTAGSTPLPPPAPAAGAGGAPELPKVDGAGGPPPDAGGPPPPPPEAGPPPAPGGDAGGPPPPPPDAGPPVPQAGPPAGK